MYPCRNFHRPQNCGKINCGGASDKRDARNEVGVWKLLPPLFHYDRLFIINMCPTKKIYKNQIENIEKGQRHASFIKCTSTHLQSTQTKREDFVSFRLLSFQFDRFMREGDYACSQNVFIFMLRY